MDFNRLKTFLVVAETGNMTQAAKLLYRTQPAITQQMKLFQEELDLVLFEKRKARIFLTPQGQALYEFAKPHVRQLEDFPLQMRNDEENVPGIIRLGATPELGPLIAPSLCVPFQQKYPKIQFQFDLYKSKDLERAILENHIDFGIAMDVTEDQQLSGFSFPAGQRVPVVSPIYLASRPPLTDNHDILNLDLLQLNSPLGDWSPWLETRLRNIAGQWQTTIPCIILNDLHSLQEMLIRGMGVGMGFLPLMAPHLASGVLQTLWPDLEADPFEAMLVRRTARNPNWAHDLFDDFVRDLPDDLLTQAVPCNATMPET